jgi:hypothetical protein
VIDIDHHEVRGRRPARSRADLAELKIERPSVGQPRERIGQGIVHRATQFPAQLGKLGRAPAEFRLEPANMRREVPVFVDGRAEQPLQLRRSRWYGDARLIRRDRGGARRASD